MIIKLVKSELKQLFSSTKKQWSVLITLVATLILISPLCGFLFQCGCDWPWSGLDSDCNYYKPIAKHRCPWCSSMIAGIASSVLAILCGLTAAIISFSTFFFIKYLSINEIFFRTLLGISTFFLIAILTASISAMYQNYPLGLGKFFFY
ncbi:MAG: hypothetical protein L3J59_06940 [Methylococcaceae bacterium]|nr:hypothetical protein [Methylococcaceae bacterium]